MRQNGPSQNSVTEFQIGCLTLEGSQNLARATAELALACLAHSASGDDSAQAFRIDLHGDLGAGKTTFARFFLHACGVEGRIKSPSFSVLESYVVDDLPLHHLDFYRQTDPTAWQAGGLRDVMLDRAIVLVEWPEHAAGLPPPQIELWLSWAIEGDGESDRKALMRIHQADPIVTDSACQTAFLRWQEMVKRLADSSLAQQITEQTTETPKPHA
jgi:tRNA threonylcarbamoyladenosine biosynthesis protein TsaE